MLKASGAMKRTMQILCIELSCRWVDCGTQQNAVRSWTICFCAKTGHSTANHCFQYKKQFAAWQTSLQSGILGGRTYVSQLADIIIIFVIIMYDKNFIIFSHRYLWYLISICSYRNISWMSKVPGKLSKKWRSLAIGLKLPQSNPKIWC